MGGEPATGCEAADPETTTKAGLLGVLPSTCPGFARSVLPGSLDWLKWELGVREHGCDEEQFQHM